MHKRTEFTKINANAKSAPLPGMQKQPLNEGLALGKPKLIFLDTCYLISLARSGYSIKESLERLKVGSGDEIVVTRQVLDELNRISKDKRKAEDGSLVLEGRKLAEIEKAVHSGLATIENVDITQSEREKAKGVLKTNSKKDNSRVGEGELSIWVLAKQMKGLFDNVVMSEDSDVPALMSAV